MTYICTVLKHLTFREITELHKVNAAKSTEVQVSMMRCVCIGIISAIIKEFQFLCKGSNAEC